MAGAVNLLLLLSALLSALTGGATAMRTPAAAHAVASTIVAAQVEGRPAYAIARPVQALPSLAVVATAFPRCAVVALAAAEPLYASRRRE
jgi:hypothetical protein